MTAATNNFRAAGWRTATYCGPNGGNCVEVNRGATDVTGIVGVRDSKRGGALLAFGVRGWRSFTEGTRRRRHGR